MYEALELSAFTSDILDKVKIQDIENQTVEKYWKVQDNQLKNSGITNRAIRDGILERCKGPINEFIGSLQKLYSLRMTQTDALNYIYFEDDLFKINKSYTDELLEKYGREYSEDVDEIEFLAAVKVIHSAYQRYIEVAEKVNATYRISQSFAVLDVLFDSHDGKWAVSPSRAVNYHRFARRNMKEQLHRL